MKKYNCGKVFVEVKEVKQLSSKSIEKGEVFTIVKRTLWVIDTENWIKYKGHNLRAYPIKDGSGYYRASL